MNHYEFHSKFTDKYGRGLMTAIAQMDLSNEYIKIYGECADEVGTPTNEIDRAFGRGESKTLENCLEDCHVQTFQLVETEFFTRLTRESAVAVCNTLFIADSKIEICEGEPDLLLNAENFAYEWNRFHPEEKKITKNMDYIV